MRIVATRRSSEDIARAWRALIQKRREHLTELYRNGRYKRYFTEQALLQAMRESANAAQDWDAFIARKAAPGRTEPELKKAAA